MELYKFEEFLCKLSLVEKVNTTKKFLDECGLKISYVLFETFYETSISTTRQEKLVNIIGYSDACKFITYPHYNALLVTEPEIIISDISKYPATFFRGFSHMYLGGVKHFDNKRKTDYTADQMTDGKGFFTRSIRINVQYYKNKISITYPLPIEDERFNKFTQKFHESQNFKFDYDVTQAKLTKEEESFPVNIPKLKNAEKYEGIFRYEPNKNYNTGEKVRTNLSSALNKALTPELREKLTITGKGTSFDFRYRNKENHIVSAVLDNGTSGAAAYKNSGRIQPVAIFNVVFKGVNFNERLCARFCHNTSQDVLNDFVRECMQFLTEIIEETDSFAHTVTELKTPPYFD